MLSLAVKTYHYQNIRETCMNGAQVTRSERHTGLSLLELRKNIICT